MRDLKYLAAYIAPILVLVGLYFGGITTYFGVLFAVFLIPVLEFVLPRSSENLSKEEVNSKLSNKLFDALLYLNLPLVWGSIAFFLFGIVEGKYNAFELVRIILSLGIVMGASGINVAHELGHRFNRFEQAMAQALLLPSLYMHFTIEHNLGHHRHVSTDEDPASAARGQNLYAFLPQSVWGGYVSAWQLERTRLANKNLGFWSISNEMIRFTIIQALLIAAVGLVFGPFALAGFIAASAIGIGLLETVNYIEHYGLRREQRESGRYERVMPHHSWNSGHPYGRLMLYELTRHSDHHYLASRPYQILRHFGDAPQMPAGYPAMVLLATVPPLWFAVMNPLVDQVMAKQYAQRATA